eukprot:gene18644-25159_t
MADTESSYKIKRLEFLGREVPIFCQNQNGPCPLLAVANILSLSNRLPAGTVSPGATSFSTSRLTSVVAETILDSNARDLTSETELAANLRQNIADCLEVLGRMSTGVDVNIRFHSVDGFEATKEVAVFDLLGISLVHGWLVDPQDQETARVLGQKSYNELVEVLISNLGDGELSRMASGTKLDLRGGSRTRSVGSFNSVTEQLPLSDSQLAAINASCQLGSVSIQGPPIDTAVPSQGPPSDTVVQIQGLPSDTAAATGESLGQAAASSSSSQQQPEAAAAAAVQESQKAVQESQKAAHAIVIKAFMEMNCSQLTVHGLSCLYETLRDNQLAVFFRNNHFNAMFKYNHQLFLLVTDQGYIDEANVAWERLDAVDGDTQMCGPDFIPYIAKERSTTTSQPGVDVGFEADLRSALDDSMAPSGPTADADLGGNYQQAPQQGGYTQSNPMHANQGYYQPGTQAGTQTQQQQMLHQQQMAYAQAQQRQQNGPAGGQPRGQTTSGSQSVRRRIPPPVYKKEESSCAIM